VISLPGLRQVTLLQAGTGVIDSMDIDIEAFLKPPCQARILGVDLVGHDADRCPPVDLFQPLEDWTQVALVTGSVPHVINRQNDDRFDSHFPDPLRCRQFRELT